MRIRNWNETCFCSSTLMALASFRRDACESRSSCGEGGREGGREGREGGREREGGGEGGRDGGREGGRREGGRGGGMGGGREGGEGGREGGVEGGSREGGRRGCEEERNKVRDEQHRQGVWKARSVARRENERGTELYIPSVN